MNFGMEEFLNERESAQEESSPETQELDVQKAVVESLAADKAMQDEEIAGMQAHIAELQSQVDKLKSQLAAEQERQFDLQTRNPNALALIDREVELPDRFPGESRDHVLEAIKKERDIAEREGRYRCAQVLEGVLVANEPNGELQNRRSALKKLFEKNANVINGEVIAALNELGISYKDGEKYLLVSEIMNRAY